MFLVFIMLLAVLVLYLLCRQLFVSSLFCGLLCEIYRQLHVFWYSLCGQPFIPWFFIMLTVLCFLRSVNGRLCAFVIH